MDLQIFTLIVSLVSLFLVFLFWLRHFFPIILTFKVLDQENASLPTRAYHRAACFDVYASEDVVVPAGQWREIRTGISYAPWPHIYIKWLNLTLTPFGNVALKIHTRSGLATKKGLRNHLGVIDGDYRGELTIWIFNHRKDYPVRFHIGDKIAQIEAFRPPLTLLFQVNKLSSSLRGAKGFGSSGK